MRLWFDHCFDAGGRASLPESALTHEAHRFHLYIDGTLHPNDRLRRYHPVITEALVLLYLMEGAPGFAALEGDGALLLYDTARDLILLHRCRLTGMPLFYVLHAGRLTVSSHPALLLQRTDLRGDPDPASIARYFLPRPDTFDEQVFREVRTVAPGQTVTVTAQGVREFSPPLEPAGSERAASDPGTALRYRTLLNAAIERSIHPGEKHGIMLSSGMDSASIAALAAARRDLDLAAFSWMLPGDAADETDRIRRLCRDLNLPLFLYDGSDFAPFDQIDPLFLLPGTPFVNPFVRLNQSCYRVAADAGYRLLFNGNYADLLFKPSRHSFAELLHHRRFDLFPETLAQHLRLKSLKAWLRPKPAPTLPAYLTPHARELLAANPPPSVPSARAPYFAGYLGNERYMSGACGVTRIEPHRDPALVDFAMQLPTFMHYRRAQTKFFAREAMRGLLPDYIRHQPRVGLLSAFTLQSFRRNRAAVRERLLDERAAWSDYISAPWMETRLEAEDVNGTDTYLFWLSLHMAPWLRAIAAIRQGTDPFETQEPPRRSVRVVRRIDAV